MGWRVLAEVPPLESLVPAHPCGAQPGPSKSVPVRDKASLLNKYVACCVHAAKTYICSQACMEETTLTVKLCESLRLPLTKATSATGGQRDQGLCLLPRPSRGSFWGDE